MVFFKKNFLVISLFLLISTFICPKIKLLIRAGIGYTESAYSHMPT